jgi:hypothetical protein
MNIEQISELFPFCGYMKFDDFIKKIGLKSLMEWDMSGGGDYDSYLHIGKIGERFFFCHDQNGTIYNFDSDYGFLDEQSEMQ